MKHDNYSISSRLVTIMQSISNVDDDTLAKVCGCKNTKAFINKRLRTGFSIDQLFEIAKCCNFEIDFVFKYNGIQIPLSSLIKENENNEEYEFVILDNGMCMCEKRYKAESDKESKE